MSKRSKDTLGEIAKGYGVELDLTQPWADLNAQVQALESGSNSGESQEQEAPAPAVRRYFRNKLSGQVVAWNPIFERNQDLELIEEPMEPEAPAEE